MTAAEKHTGSFAFSDPGSRKSLNISKGISDLTSDGLSLGRKLSRGISSMRKPNSFASLINLSLVDVARQTNPKYKAGGGFCVGEQWNSALRVKRRGRIDSGQQTMSAPIRRSGLAEPPSTQLFKLLSSPQRS